MMGQMVGSLVSSVAAVNVERWPELDALMAAEQRRVFALCLRMLRDREEADSATQDVFLKAYRALKATSDRPSDSSRWIMRIAVNTCLDRLRSRKWQFWRRRPKPEVEQSILSEARAEAPGAEQQVFSAQIGKRLNDAMGRLSGRQLAVFHLRHYEERSLEEIGAILGLDTGTVKAHMYRAVKKLRVELREFYESTIKDKRK